MRIVTGLRLLFKNPSLFVFRLKDIIHRVVTKYRLQSRAHKASALPIWIQYGKTEFPFYNDADEQEISYHCHFTEWHQATVDTFSTHLPQGGVAVDVGANIGFVTLVLSNLAGPNGSVFSFEPGGFMFRKLSDLVQRNQLHNVKLHKMGCGSKRDVLDLVIPSSSGNSSLRPTEDIEGQTRFKEKVEIAPLDELLSSLSRLDLLKIDTEGFEIEVLKGANQTISRHQPVIYIELSSEYRESSQASIDWLRSKGYSFSPEPDLNSARNGDNFLAFPFLQRERPIKSV